jgi:hypothetical protein
MSLDPRPKLLDAKASGHKRFFMLDRGNVIDDIGFLVFLIRKDLLTCKGGCPLLCCRHWCPGCLSVLSDIPLHELEHLI